MDLLFPNRVREDRFFLTIYVCSVGRTSWRGVAPPPTPPPLPGRRGWVSIFIFYFYGVTFQRLASSSASTGMLKDASASSRSGSSTSERLVEKVEMLIVLIPDSHR